MSSNVTEIDLRDVPVMERHPRVFDEWEALEHGSSLRVINDYDPKPLYYQFEGEFKGEYEWEYEKEGPEWVIRITKPRRPVLTPEELRAKVEEALEEVRPYLQADGGDVELVELDAEEKKVLVKLTGKCGGCPSAELTLKGGVERTIKKHAPDIVEVSAIM